MRRLEETFSGDYRVMRVCMSTASPIDTLHKIRTHQYSIRTFLDMLEMLDVKATVEENEMIRHKANMENNKRK